jgi:hypothetical protein
VKEIFTFDTAKDSAPFAELLREEGEVPKIDFQPAEDFWPSLLSNHGLSKGSYVDPSKHHCQPGAV